MGVVAIVSLGVVLVTAGVTAVCVAVLDHEARRFDAAARHLAAVVAGSPAVEGTR